MARALHAPDGAPLTEADAELDSLCSDLEECILRGQRRIEDNAKLVHNASLTRSATRSPTGAPNHIPKPSPMSVRRSRPGASRSPGAEREQVS